MTDTYLVTGGAGFIGSNFVRFLLESHEDVQVVNVDALTYAGRIENLGDAVDDERHVFVHADIRSSSTMADLLSSYDPRFVVNFAAESHVDRSIASPGVFVGTNVVGTTVLLEEVRRAWESPDGPSGKRRFLQVSTDEVYGSLPLDRPDALFREETSLDPHSPYSASKASADLIALSYHVTYGVPVVVTRCSNNYGPRQHPEKLIPLTIERALRHEPIPIYGDGLNVRDWLYVKDHCRALDLVLRKGVDGQVYNVGGRSERANVDVVRLVLTECARLTGDCAIEEGLISFTEDRKGHDRRYGISTEKIATALGWEPTVAFEEGLRQTVRWYLENQEWLGRARG